MGQKMMSFVKDLAVVDPKTFKIVLKEQTGLVLPALGKPSSNVPFMMPKRVAETAAERRRSPTSRARARSSSRRTSGSPATRRSTSSSRSTSRGPSRPRRWPAARWSRSTAWSGARSAITRRPSTPSSPARSTTSSRRPTISCLCSRRTPTSSWWTPIPLGNQYAFRYNTLAKPFDNAKVRQAVMVRLQSEGLPRGGHRRSRLLQGLQGDVPVRLAQFDSTKGMDGCLESNFEKAKALLKEAGYDGTPIVLMHSTDLAVLTNLAPVAKNAHGEGRLQGGHAVHGLADAGVPPRQEGPAAPRAAGTPS